MYLMYMRSKKRQDLLSKFGAQGSWERAAWKGRGRKMSEEKYIAQQKDMKKKRQKNYMKIYAKDMIK